MRPRRQAPRRTRLANTVVTINTFFNGATGYIEMVHEENVAAKKHGMARRHSLTNSKGSFMGWICDDDMKETYQALPMTPTSMVTDKSGPVTASPGKEQTNFRRTTRTRTAPPRPK